MKSNCDCFLSLNTFNSISWALKFLCLKLLTTFVDFFFFWLLMRKMMKMKMLFGDLKETIYYDLNRETKLRPPDMRRGWLIYTFLEVFRVSPFFFNLEEWIRRLCVGKFFFFPLYLSRLSFFFSSLDLSNEKKKKLYFWNFVK